MSRLVRKPTLLGLRPVALVELYRWRLSSHKAQELLAGTGIAIGVALFFGVLVANSSLIGSASQLVHAVTGRAQLQLVARSPDGFDESLAEKVGALPGVKVAAPLVRKNAVIVGPKGREAIQLIGVTPSQVFLKGAATQNLGSGALLLAGGIGLPTSVAEKTGAQASQAVTLFANGDAHRIEVRAVLGSQEVGAIADSPIVAALLPTVQQLTGMRHRVTEVFVEAAPGRTHTVESELRRLASGRVDVKPATAELPILAATAQPTSQSTALFAAIAAMVGFLLALNAMLLTVPERRRFAAELRHQGFGPRQVLLVLVSQAVMLGLVASIVGVALGDVLSTTLFHQVPSYLSLAFPIGTRPVVPVATTLLAIGCGVLAAVLASMLPLSDLWRGRRPDAVLHESGEAGQRIGLRTVLGSGSLALVLVAGVTVVLLLAPDLSILGGVVLALATVCLIPATFVGAIAILKPASERRRGSMLALAVVELDATATRSIALAGVAAVAVFGMVTIQGARRDLLAGLDSAVVQYLNTADIWVTTDDNFLTVNQFRAGGAPSAISHAPGVASVREYQGQLLDVGSRRLWLRARPAGDRTLIQASQLLHGDLASATRALRHDGWAAISNGFASERHLRVGDSFLLPSASGAAPFSVAAITTNVGWPPGAITINDADYRRYWRSPEPTALEVNLKPGVSAAEGKRIVGHVLANQPGLLIETFTERKARYEASARQGIKSLSEIATLMLIATSLAIASALSAAIWQRRARLASLKSHGFDSRQLWRSIVLESGILLTIGCVDGTILGVYGHALASRWLKLSVGFPAPFSLGVTLVLLTLGVIVSVALAVIALPGLAAARVPTRASFQE
jgi:putative ABC transport system permease protein